MRVYIKQCRHCTMSKDECDYLQDLKESCKGILKGKKFRHNCERYNEIFQPGDRVEIKLYHLRLNHFYGYDSCDYEYNAPTRWEAYHKNPVMGTIMGGYKSKIYNDIYFKIHLDEEVKLYRADWRARKESLVEFWSYNKIAKDIKLILPQSLHDNLENGESRFKLMQVNY